MLIAEVADALQRRTLALFLGSDLPLNVTGLPSRSDLARELAHQYHLDESLSLAEVAQRASQAGGRWGFTDFICRKLDVVGKAPQLFHQRLVALVQQYRIETVLTTAYDNLLELAFQQTGVAVNRVVRGSDVNFINPDRPTIIKLYGDTQQPDTLVVTDRDHVGLLRDREKEAMLDEVRQTFRRKTILFLGYNLADLDFRFLFDQVAESKFARTSYAVWPSLSEVDTRTWRDRGVAIWDQDPFELLGKVGAQSVSPVRAQVIVAMPQGEALLTPDTEAIRQLVADAFSDEELTTLCFDHFRPAHEAFSGGMTKTAKIQLLLEHCVRQDEVDWLLALVRERNPNQYNRFVAHG